MYLIIRTVFKGRIDRRILDIYLAAIIEFFQANLSK